MKPHSDISTFLLSGEVTNICTQKVDLGFILDSSDSIGASNFEKMKSFVKDLTDHFKISQDYTRVSLMSYATTSTLHFSFSQEYATQQDLHSAIDIISYSGGSTYTNLALVKAYTDMFNADNGARLSGLFGTFLLLYAKYLPPKNIECTCYLVKVKH